MDNHWKIGLLNIAIVLGCLIAQPLNSQVVRTSGPEQGTLLLAGGAAGPDIYKTFIELAGGPDANIVVIPTAAGLEEYTHNVSGAGLMRELGANYVTVVHARSKEEANNPGLVQKVQAADAIWFGGGRQWRLVDAYANTPVEEAFWTVLENGGVIGGSSAGATIQGSYLVRGDTETNQIMMGDHEVGFGFIQNIAVDQHVLARNRHFDLLQILTKRPELLGIAIDEGTAIVVQKNIFTVIGNSYVIVYDQGFWSREGSDQKVIPAESERFYFLKATDRYDLFNRSVFRP